MTDTFANGPTTPGDAAPRQPGDVTGTLAELERKLRELERELTSIGRRREPVAASGVADAGEPVAEAPAQGGGRLVDEVIEPPAAVEPAATVEAPAPVQPPAAAQPQAPVEPAAPVQHLTPVPPPAPVATPAPVEPPPPVEPAGAGHPVKFVRPTESERAHFPREPRERVRPTETQLASLAELRRFRDRLERFAEDLTVEYDALLSRVMAGLTTASPPVDLPPSAPLYPAAPPPPVPGPPPVPPPPPAPPSPEEALFEGSIELGVGPFYDIASLSAFERRLASLPNVAEASVRRFEASHAVVDVRLAAPVALVPELRRAGETDFNVREVADGRILLTFDEG
jgi:hypothetical protein